MAAPNKTSKSSSSTLPVELILEIFTYLPTKSLKRLRYVFDNEFPAFSKSLGTYSFQHKHASNILTNPTSAKLLIEGENSNNLKEIDSYPFKPPSITHSYNFKKLFKNILPYKSENFYDSEVIGGFNGLICLYFAFYRELKKNNHVCGCCAPLRILHHLILWNPCTGDHHVIPTPQGLRLNLCRGRSLSTVCGFGYDSVNKTYKLVIGEGEITQIYNLSTNSWKIVDTIGIDWDDYKNFKLSYSVDSKPQFGYYLNGSLHWIASSTSIATIDLSTEVCRFINMPHCCCCSQEKKHCSNMGVLKGCLSVSCYRFVGKRVSIWVMKEYGREDSWTNIIDITLSETDMLPGLRDLMVIRPPLWVSRDDEMLFLVGGKLAYWNPKAQKLNYVKGLEFESSFRGIVHVDTLVSPKPEVYGLGSGDNSGEVLVLK